MPEPDESSATDPIAGLNQRGYASPSARREGGLVSLSHQFSCAGRFCHWRGHAGMIDYRHSKPVTLSDACRRCSQALGTTIAAIPLAHSSWSLGHHSLPAAQATTSAPALVG